MNVRERENIEQLNAYGGSSLIRLNEDVLAQKNKSELVQLAYRIGIKSMEKGVIMDIWNESSVPIETERVKPLITITVEPVSSDECSESEPDDSCVFFELSETETSEKTVEEQEDRIIMASCERKRSDSVVESESRRSERAFQRLTGSPMTSYARRKSDLMRANSSPEDANFAGIDSGYESSLKIETEKPRRRNTLADIFRWFVSCLLSSFLYFSAMTSTPETIPIFSQDIET